MFAEYVLPIAAVAAAVFVAAAFLKGGVLGLLAALALVSALSFGRALIRWLGWPQG